MVRTVHRKYYHQPNKCYPLRCLLAHFEATLDLLTSNNISEICYCGQISLQSAAVNCIFSYNLTPLWVTFILLPMVQFTVQSTNATLTADTFLLIFIYVSHNVHHISSSLQWINFLFPALYGVLFPTESEAAYSNYNLWRSTGFIIAFICSTLVCIPVKIYTLTAFLVLGITGYGIIEWMEYKKENS